MKNHLLNYCLTAVLSAGLFACTSGGSQSEEAEVAEKVIPEAATAENTAQEAAGQMMIAWHHVKDYGHWRKTYNAHLPAITDAGMERLVVGRENGDKNHIFVAHRISDLASARAFAESEDLKAKMEKGGVVGPPRIRFVDVVDYDGAYTKNMDRVMISHRVADWNTFLGVFYDVVESKGQHGIEFLFLGRDADDPNMVYIVEVVDDREAAEAYMNSEDLKDKMAEATVEGEVEVIYFTVEYIDDAA